MTLSVNGVSVGDTDSFWTEPAELADGSWATKWLYAIPDPVTSDVVVVWSETLDHQSVDLLEFDADGEPIHTPAGFAGGGTCVIRPV
jgi:hypothetical protein